VVALAAALVALGGLTLCEYALGRSLGIDELVVRVTPGADGSSRMAPAAALNFVLIGLALALHDVRARAARFAAEALATLTLLSASVALLGYVYSARPRARALPRGRVPHRGGLPGGRRGHAPGAARARARAPRRRRGAGRRLRAADAPRGGPGARRGRLGAAPGAAGGALRRGFRHAQKMEVKSSHERRCYE
jgi:hypothetical protein